jgi:HEAT repeat protein
METEVMHASENEKQCHERPVRGHTAKLIAQLGSHDGMERQHAREELVRLGEPIVGLLIAALSADRVVFRWEAAKALTDLHAPAAAATLVNTLADEDSDVRWLAAEALAGLGEPALPPLFEALMTRSDSVELREGAHHVLRALNQGDLADIVTPVLKTLEQYEPELAVPFSAEEALAELNKRRT